MKTKPIILENQPQGKKRVYVIMDNGIACGVWEDLEDAELAVERVKKHSKTPKSVYHCLLTCNSKMTEIEEERYKNSWDYIYGENTYSQQRENTFSQQRIEQMINQFRTYSSISLPSLIIRDEPSYIIRDEPYMPEQDNNCEDVNYP